MSLPFKPGDWVGDTQDDLSPIFGRVKECFLDPDEHHYINLIVFSTHGERVGRRSPPEGGPKGYEPYLRADRFKRIEEPSFPIKVDKWSRSYRLDYLPDGA